MIAAYARYSAVEPTEEELVLRYGPLIERVARRIARRMGTWCSADELWSAGAMGLLDAARRYEGDRSVKFETFAEHRIRGAILDELRNMDHLPRRLRAATDSVGKARAKLTHQMGRDPTVEELSQSAGVSVEELGSLETLAQPPVPLTPEMSIAADAILPDARASQGEQRAQLVKAIGTLPERLQLVLSLHYVEDLSYREIAKILQVSEPRVCQLHSDALKKLRVSFSSDEEAAAEPAP